MGKAREPTELTDLLNRPSAGIHTPPPVKTLRDRLPFQSLHWPDFERLCKRLLDLRPGLEPARAYGVPGDEQGGIDLYARRLGSDRYEVVQAKKVVSFTPAQVEAAVDRFLGLDGRGRPRKGAERAPWHERADTFILAVTTSLDSRRVDEKWRIQEARLSGRGITAMRWGIPDLEDLLRHQPGIVYEFFGQDWVEAFCLDSREWLETFRSSIQAASELRHLRLSIAYATQHYLGASSALLLPWQERNEVTEAMALLQDPEERKVLILTGRAGLGKSGVTVKIVEQAQEQAWEVLAFRLDFVQPTDHELKLGESLGLQDAPVEALARASEGRPCLLVIDQLDAVSKASGRHPQFFEVVRRLLTAAQQHPNMRVVMACRDFDLANDDRFKILVKAESPVARKLRLSELNAEQVEAVMTDLGFAPDRLSPSQLAVLRVPLHLSLFYEGWTERTASEALAFVGVNDLYRLFTRRKEEQLQQTMDQPQFRLSVALTLLVRRMSNDMTLSLPEALADQLVFDTALYSAGILRVQSGRIAFFHEGYFDYLFARQFVVEGKTLLSVLLEGEQHLFRRAQVRQVLTLLREQDRGQYLQSVRDLLFSAEVRFHLKELIFGLLWQWPDPTGDEWELIEGATASPERELADLAQWSVHAPAWSRYLAAEGILGRWFVSVDLEEQRRAASALETLLRVTPDAFLEVVRPLTGHSDEQDRRIADTVGWQLETGHLGFFDFVTELFHRGQIDDHRYWHALEHLSRTQIERAVESCALLLQTLAARPAVLETTTGSTGRADHVITDDWPATELFERSVNERPHLFVERVMPALMTLAANYAYPDQLGERFQDDRIWRYRLDFGVDHATDALLEAVIRALNHLDVDRFRQYALQLQESRLEVAQYILLRGYLGHMADCADEAIVALCEEPSRLRISEHGMVTWLSFRLLRATTPTTSDEVLRRLEQLLLQFESRRKMSRAGYGADGLDQYRLLSGIVPERRSQAVQKRIGELARRFPTERPEVPRRMFWGGVVGSPISAEAVERMTDDQWLRAMQKHHSDGMDSHKHTDDGGIIGGASQLAGALGEEAKKDPERFARLALDWPDTLHPVYFERLVMALRDAPLDISLTVQLAARCHDLAGKPCGRWLPDLFGQRPDLEWPVEALELVADCALNDPDPVEDTWHRPDGYRDPYTQGINSVRGTAAEVIGRLLFAKPERSSIFEPVIERLLTDAVVAVRACVALPVGAMLNIDTDLAIRWFLQLAETRDEFLAGPHALRFLTYTVDHHFDRVRPLIERMVHADSEEVARLGAGLAVRAAFWHPQARDSAAEVIVGTSPQRLGAAEVLSSAIGASDPDIVRQCTDGLVPLFSDPEETVRRQSSKFAGRLDPAAFPRHADLLRAFLASPAFRDEPIHLLHQLQESAFQLPDTLLQAAEAYFPEHRPEAGQGARDASYIREFGRLLFPLYSQHLNRALPDEDVLTRCLNLFDRMAARRSQEYQDGMQLVER